MTGPEREAMADGVMLAARMLNESADTSPFPDSPRSVFYRAAAAFLTRKVEEVTAGIHDSERGRKR